MLNPNEYGRQAELDRVKEQYAKLSRSVRYGYRLVNDHVNLTFVYASQCLLLLVTITVLMDLHAPEHWLRWPVKVMLVLMTGGGIRRWCGYLKRRKQLEQTIGFGGSDVAAQYARQLSLTDKNAT